MHSSLACFSILSLVILPNYFAVPIPPTCLIMKTIFVITYVLYIARGLSDIYIDEA